MAHVSLSLFDPFMLPHSSLTLPVLELAGC